MVQYKKVFTISLKRINTVSGILCYCSYTTVRHATMVGLSEDSTDLQWGVVTVIVFNVCDDLW